MHVLASVLLALTASLGTPAIEDGDVQLAWLGGASSGGPQWIVSRPGWSRDGASGAIWGFDADGQRVWQIPGFGMGKRLGYRLARIGDVDGDGCADFVASSYGGPWRDRPEVLDFQALKTRPLPLVEHLGSVRCFSGVDGRKLWVAWSQIVGDRYGEVIAEAGDFDGDGASDVAVGSTTYVARGISESLVLGRDAVEIRSGADGSLLHVFDKPWGGADLYDRFGHALAGGGDLDGDRWPELAIGSPGAVLVDGARGRIDVYRGRDRAHLAVIAPQPRGLEPYPGTCGEVLGTLPDLDGDGVAELFASVLDRRVDVLDGATRTWVLHLQSPMFSGNDFYSGFGSSVAVAGDVDGDGRLDLLVGAREEWPETEGERYDLALYSGCDGRYLHGVASVGRQSAVAGARAAPWDVLIAFPAHERVHLVREGAWADPHTWLTLERLRALELKLD
jgi:hypothetical protein